MTNPALSKFSSTNYSFQFNFLSAFIGIAIASSVVCIAMATKTTAHAAATAMTAKTLATASVASSTAAISPLLIVAALLAASLLIARSLSRNRVQVYATDDVFYVNGGSPSFWRRPQFPSFFSGWSWPTFQTNEWKRSWSPNVTR